MWVPKMKFLSGLFALLGQFRLPNGTFYEGPMHQDELGRFKTGAAPSEDSLILIEDPDEITDEQILEQEFFSSIENLPVPADYKTGFMKRYFLKNTITSKIIEVDKNFYKKDRRSKELYIQKLMIKWVIAKPVKDIFNQGYVFEGAATRNKKAVMKANLEMKGIIDYLTDYAKFANIESDVEGYKFEELPPKEQTRIIKETSTNLRNKPKPIKEDGGNLRDGGGLNYINKPVSSSLPVINRPSSRGGNSTGSRGGGSFNFQDEGFNEEGRFGSTNTRPNQNISRY